MTMTEVEKLEDRIVEQGVEISMLKNQIREMGNLIIELKDAMNIPFKNKSYRELLELMVKIIKESPVVYLKRYW